MLRFEAFQIDTRTWTLTRSGEVVDLSPRLVEILAFLAARAGDIVTKDELLDHFWPEVHVAENTLTRAIADIRKAIGDSSESPRFLQTLARRGYRFVPNLNSGAEASADAGAREVADGDVRDPFQAWVSGRMALDTLDLSKLSGAVASFERAATELPQYGPAHAGLANAYLLQFETTRSGSTPDRTLLARATASARRACTVEPSLGEGWAVLGYLLCAAGKTDEGQAAARRATALEPDNWRHHYRLAHATWGEERLRAVDRTLTLVPGFAPAYILSAMVFVARGANARAERDATLGADAQRRHQHDKTPLPAAGLHWIRGLLLAAKGDDQGALASFAEEIATSTSDHIYAREFAANARVATGAVQLACGDREGAEVTFSRALEETPHHPRATLGLLAASASGAPVEDRSARERATQVAIDELEKGERHVEAALISAGRALMLGGIDESHAILDALLTGAAPGPAGWIVPVDPMFGAIRSATGYPDLLAKLAARAV